MKFWNLKCYWTTKISDSAKTKGITLISLVGVWSLNRWLLVCILRSEVQRFRFFGLTSFDLIGWSTNIRLITARNWRLRRLCFYTYLSFCSRGGSASVHAGIPYPPGPGPPQAPPGPGTPQTRHPPAQCMLGDTVNKRAVRILLECNLVNLLDSPS